MRPFFILYCQEKATIFSHCQLQRLLDGMCLGGGGGQR